MIKEYSSAGRTVEVSIMKDGVKIASLEASEVYLDTDKFKCITTKEMPSKPKKKIIIEV